MELTDAERAAAHAAGLRDRELPASVRRREGIVHTPAALARSVARLADQLLQESLGLAAGLADPALAIIDPACGPGAFLAAALAQGQGRAAAPAVVAGYDRDPGAIRAARSALRATFAGAAWPLALQRCDTLAELHPEHAAGVAPALLVLGNPPWIGRAQPQPPPSLRALLADFERDADGAPLGERKRGVLADAYVRFMRWALEVTRHASHGAAVALVTNGSYLDGPVHRGMRAALLRGFDALYLIDLGGNALLARGGARDDNLFGVRPQVAVLLAARAPGPAAQRNGRLHYLRVLGSHADKLAALERLRLHDPAFVPLTPAPPLLRFVPTAAVRKDYAGFVPLPELMPFHREGVQTNRDAVAIDSDHARLLSRLRAFADGHANQDLAPALLEKPHYAPARARNALREAFASDPGGERFVRPIQYRPFDLRWVAALAPLCHRPRPDLLAAMDHAGLALVTVRKDRGALPWSHATAARAVIDNCLLSTRSSCRARAFPTHAPDGSENLSPVAQRELARRVGRPVRARELVWYALAVLRAPSFARTHDEALRIDYPRIPWPRDRAQFEALAAVGRELVELLCAPLPQVHEDAGADEAQNRISAGSLHIGHHAFPSPRAPTSPALHARVVSIRACSATLDGLL